MAYYFWEGARVRLRAVEPSDWEVLYRWSEDAEMINSLGRMDFPRSREGVKEWARLEAVKEPVKDGYFFIIESLEGGEVVGSITSHSCDRRNGTFGYGIGLGEPFRRRGYASDAIILLLRFFFEELGYQKCTVTVFDFNEGSRALHEELGFQHEGTIRRTRFQGGKYHDTLMYGLTREEFDQRHVLE